MSDDKLIRLDDAISAVNGNIWWNESEKAAIRLLLHKVPTVQDEEVVNGQWETTEVTEPGEAVKKYSHFHRECKYFYTDNGLGGHYFCPNCGAKMDKDNLPSGDEKRKDEQTMDKNEIMKTEGLKELILGVQVIHLVAEAEEPGLGDEIIDVLVAELSKLRKSKIPEGVMLLRERVDRVEISDPYPTQYIGTKMIQAAPALRIEDGDGKVRIELLADKPVTQPTDTVDMGYKVIYPDGYESWSPLDAFEAAYRPTDGMNFGLALEAAKKGAKIARKGWNGKDVLVICQFSFSADDVRSYLCMEDENDLCQVWGAPQVDMLADDWYIVE